MHQFHVVIVGGGATGGALAHDLSLRGLRVTLLERYELTSGTSGRHHGLLHSGSRYAVSDPPLAAECMQENALLRKIMPGSFEANGGLAVATSDEQVEHSQRFLDACESSCIPTRVLEAGQALQREPNLSPDTRLAIEVPDATMDPMRMALRFFATAMQHGAEIRTYTEVIGMLRSGRSVSGVRVVDHRTNRVSSVAADIVVNAAGAWASDVGRLAGVQVPLRSSAGVIVAVHARLTNMVVSRLGPPADGDIVLPQRSLTLLGTTSWPVADADIVEVPREHIHRIMRAAARLVPRVTTIPLHAAWTSVRPLVASETCADDREASRGFRCIDHRSDGVEGLVTVIGGKATTARAMAEATSNVVCRKLGIDAECRTRSVTCLPYRAYFEQAA